MHERTMVESRRGLLLLSQSVVGVEVLPAGVVLYDRVFKRLERQSCIF